MLQVCAQLRGRQQQAELLVHPDAAIYPQLQLEVQAAGLVVSTHFGGEAIGQGERFEEWGMESGAAISVVSVGIDELSDEEYRALEPGLRGKLEGLLEERE